MSTHVPVMVPMDRLPEIYGILSRVPGAPREAAEFWGGEGVASAVPARSLWLDPELIRRHLLSRPATIRELAQYLASRPDELVTTEEAAEALELRFGWNSLAGALGAFGRYCTNRALPFPWETRENMPDNRVRFCLDSATAEAIVEVLGKFKG